MFIDKNQTILFMKTFIMYSRSLKFWDQLSLGHKIIEIESKIPLQVMEKTK